MLKDQYAALLIQAYSDYGIVVDTNLLLLDFVGDYDIRKISTFKRTIVYTVDDYILLQQILNSFRKVIVNQAILAEVFNLLDSLNNIENQRLNTHLRSRIHSLTEQLSGYVEIANQSSFPKFGFTDASIDILSSNNLILTDDLKLYGYLASQGKPVINFNHIRSFK